VIQLLAEELEAVRSYQEPSTLAQQEAEMQLTMHNSMLEESEILIATHRLQVSPSPFVLQ
jgi:hypothetical protein